MTMTPNHPLQRTAPEAARAAERERSVARLMARAAYGALPKRMGRNAEAGGIFRRMLRNAQRMPEHCRGAQHEWLASARQQLQA